MEGLESEMFFLDELVISYQPPYDELRPYLCWLGRSLLLETDEKHFVEWKILFAWESPVVKQHYFNECVRPLF